MVGNLTNMEFIIKRVLNQTCGASFGQSDFDFSFRSSFLAMRFHFGHASFESALSCIQKRAFGLITMLHGCWKWILEENNEFGIYLLRSLARFLPVKLKKPSPEWLKGWRSNWGGFVQFCLSASQAWAYKLALISSGLLYWFFISCITPLGRAFWTSY